MDVLNNDITMEILSFLEYPDILEVQYLNKEFYRLCNSVIFWTKFIELDFPSAFSDNPGNQKRYGKWYHCFDKYTLMIISEFILLRTKFNNLQQVYNNIFRILVNYIDDHDNSLKVDDQVVLKTINDIKYNIYTLKMITLYRQRRKLTFEEMTREELIDCFEVLGDKHLYKMADEHWVGCMRGHLCNDDEQGVEL